MKLLVTFSILFCFSMVVVFGQDTESTNKKDLTPKGLASEQTVVRESMQMMGESSQNALTMAIPNVSDKKCEEVWKEFSKDFSGKTRKDKKTDMYLSDDASIRKMSSNTVDVYAKFNESGNGTTVTVWFDLGGAFLSSEQHETAYQEANELMLDFAKAVGKSLAEDNVKEQEKVLKALEKDLDKLGKDNENYHKKIEEAKKLITEMEQNIEQNVKDQEKKQEEIKAQGTVLETAKSKVKDFN
jgi:hypothetical protein